jgi:glycosyltransferase involved in cell wall biosynthesis
VGESVKAVVFTEQFYYPEGWGGAQLPRDVTTFLARCNVRVEVICGSDKYASVDDESDGDPRSAGVVIHRIPRLLGGSTHYHKASKQIWFYLGCVPLLLFRRSPSVFVTQTNPPLVVPLVALAALVHRRPFVIIAQDIYPEVLFAHGMAARNGLWGRLLSAIFSWAYRRAAKVVALGGVMARRLASKGVHERQIAIISNWATGELSIDRSDANNLRRDWGLEGQFVILYSGNVGIAHDVETPISALRILLTHSANVRLVVIGDGSRIADAQRAARDAGVLHAVQFHALVPAARLPQTLGLAQVALVTLREGFEGLVVPSKLLGYMARGVPTVYVGPYSDVEQLLNESGGGKCVRNGDAEGLCQEILMLMVQPDRAAAMGAAALSYYHRHLSRSQGLQKYATVIGAAASGRRESAASE